MKRLIEQGCKASSVVLLASLTACGGGGGGGGGTSGTAPVINAPVTPGIPTPPVTTLPVDGLGEAGHLAGTVQIDASLFKDSMTGEELAIAVGLSNDGKALATWQVNTGPISPERVVGWSQSNSAGVFGAPALLPQTGTSSSQYRIAMRMNESGNAVLALVNGGNPSNVPRVARFIDGSGWDAVTYDPTAGVGKTSMSAPGTSWDLSMLADNSFTFSAATTNSVSVAQTRVGGQQSRLLETESDPSGKVYGFSYFAPKSTGYGLLYTAKNVISAFNGKNYQTQDISARLADVSGVKFAPIELGNFGPLCTHKNLEGPMVAVTTERAEGVLAVSAMDMDGCQTENLQLIRVYTQGSIKVENQRLNSAGTYLPVAPAVTVDKDGNALAVWMEKDGQSSQMTSSTTTRIMWSQSLYGGVWSKPQALATNSTALGDDFIGLFPISLAMNASGQAVIALRRGVDNPIVSVRRFDFKAGWGDWKPVANKWRLSAPAVAINASGQAEVVYAGMDTNRVNGKAPTGGAGSSKMGLYALRF